MTLSKESNRITIVSAWKQVLFFEIHICQIDIQMFKPLIKTIEMKIIKPFMFPKVTSSKKPCGILSALTFKNIPVNYPAATILGEEREAQVKIWNVAVTTAEPTHTHKSFNDWQYDMIDLRGKLHDYIGLLEHYEIAADAKMYNRGNEFKYPQPVKNN